jgi:hypothetical protein
MARVTFTCRGCRRRVQCPRYLDPEDVNLCVACENDGAMINDRVTRRDLTENAIEHRLDVRSVFILRG